MSSPCSAWRPSDIHDGWPLSYGDMHNDGFLPPIGVHIAVNKARRDVEVVANPQFNGIAARRPIVETNPTCQEEPIEVPPAVMMPGRDDASGDSRTTDHDTVVLECALPNDPFRGIAAMQLAAPHDLDRGHDPGDDVGWMNVESTRSVRTLHSTVTLFARFRGLSIGQSCIFATS